MKARAAKFWLELRAQPEAYACVLLESGHRPALQGQLYHAPLMGLVLTSLLFFLCRPTAQHVWTRKPRAAWLGTGE